jgi:hypothetical protein
VTNIDLAGWEATTKSRQRLERVDFLMMMMMMMMMMMTMMMMMMMMMMIMIYSVRNSE